MDDVYLGCFCLETPGDITQPHHGGANNNAVYELLRGISQRGQDIQGLTSIPKQGCPSFTGKLEEVEEHRMVTVEDLR